MIQLIYSFIEDDPAPSIITSLIPEDIIINHQKVCNVECTELVTWDVNPQDVFTDNCQELRFEQSHFSPLMVDENNPNVEVVYSAIDLCDNRSDFSFLIQLNCIDSQETTIAENNSMAIQFNDTCIDGQNSICINSDIEIFPTFIDEDSNTINYNEVDNPGLEYAFSVNGNVENFTFENQAAFIPSFPTGGSYEICLETITDDCETRSVNFCQTIEIYENRTVDYGVFEACS